MQPQPKRHLQPKLDKIMKVIEIESIREVKFDEKDLMDIYLLFTYRKEAQNDYAKYFLLNQSPHIEDIDKYMQKWTKQPGEEFKIFKIKLPR